MTVIWNDSDTRSSRLQIGACYGDLSRQQGFIAYFRAKPDLAIFSSCRQIPAIPLDVMNFEIGMFIGR